MIGEDGKEYTESILNLQKVFYKKLYSKNKEINGGDIETQIGENSDKLSDAEAEDLEGEIKFTEILQPPKNMKTEKSPGQDGFTAEFFKFFWVERTFYFKNFKVYL